MEDGPITKAARGPSRPSSRCWLTRPPARPPRRDAASGLAGAPHNSRTADGHRGARWTRAPGSPRWSRCYRPRRWGKRHAHAIDWLLGQSGMEPRQCCGCANLLRDGKLQPNTDVKGWPWFPGTAAWVTPTCLGILALEEVLPAAAFRENCGSGSNRRRLFCCRAAARTAGGITARRARWATTRIPIRRRPGKPCWRWRVPIRAKLEASFGAGATIFAGATVLGRSRLVTARVAGSPTTSGRCSPF